MRDEISDRNMDIRGANTYVLTSPSRKSHLMKYDINEMTDAAVGKGVKASAGILSV